MTELCQQIMAKMSLVQPENGPFPYKEARLIDAQGDLAKQWLVDFSVWSEQQQLLIRKRVTVPGKTATERYRAAEKLINEINKMMRSRKGLVIEALPTTKALLSVEPSTPAAALAIPGTTIDALSLSSRSGLVEVVDYYLALKQKTLSANSHRTYATSANKLKVFLASRGLANMRLHQFTQPYAHAYREWLIHQQLANKTVNKLSEFAEGVFQLVKERKLIKDNPFGLIVALPETSGRHVPFTAAQIATFRQYLLTDQPDPQLWLFVNLIYYTCSRPHEEIRLLQIRDVGSKAIMIYGDRSKNNRSNPKPIAPPLELLIERYNLRRYPPHYYVFGDNGLPGEKPKYPKFFYNRHRAMLDALKIPLGQYDLYGWKHTGVIALYMATKDIRLIQRMCGHQQITTTEIYLRDLGMILTDNQLDGLAAI